MLSWAKQGKKFLHASLDYIKRIPIRPSLTKLILRGRECIVGSIESRELHSKDLDSVLGKKLDVSVLIVPATEVDGAADFTDSRDSSW